MRAGDSLGTGCRSQCRHRGETSDASLSARRVMSRQRILLLTGRLAEAAVRRTVAEIEAKAPFELSIHVLPISVAALMHTGWIERKFDWPTDANYDRVILPGYCQGDPGRLTQKYGVPFESGPREILDLPEYLGVGQRQAVSLDAYRIQILAEINHAPRLTQDAILRQAEHYRQSGADLIDLGCIPGEHWSGAGDTVRALREQGFRVSIDSFQQQEVEAAVEAGVELILSVNRTNIHWAKHCLAELVAIPDDHRQLETLQGTIDELTDAGARFRIDPILEPIGVGFSASLDRYRAARLRWPEIPVLMGVGNVTELAEVDSAGVNLVLAGICEELGITSILTTEVASWCGSAVREFDRARRVVKHAVEHRTIAKHLDDSLVMLRDSRRRQYGKDALAALASQLKDPNFRIFAEEGVLHLMNRDGHWSGTDPYAVFDAMQKEAPLSDAAHAYYLGYEIAKAMTALTLGKNYRQDQALNWGLLTQEESSAVERRHRESRGAE